MNFISRYKFECALAISLLAFIICKIPALSLPYFWDELGVYARGALYMHDNGIGLEPAALTPELSRGHPLFFYNIHAIAFDIFGDGVITAHCTALFITIILLISVYYFGTKYFNKQAGFIASVLCIVQAIIFTQSLMVLPEMLLALLMLWSLHFWVQKKYFAYAIVSAAAMMTKETAIIVPAVILVADALTFLFSKESRNKFFNIRQILLPVPIIVYFIFLWIQKKQNGWYLFPLHGENISFSQEKFSLFIHDYFRFVAIEQGRILILIISAIAIVILGISRKLHFNRFSLSLIVLMIAGISFNSLNFYMNRYMLFVIVAGIILFSSLMDNMIRQFMPAVLVLPVVIAVCCYTINGNSFIYKTPSDAGIVDRFSYDEDMAYLNYIDLEQQAVHYIETNVQPGDSIFTNFPMGFTLSDTRHGFTNLVNHEDFILQPRRNYQIGFAYALIIDPGSYEYHLPADDSLSIAARFENSTGHITIYKPAF